jgi:hypothetical protein
MIKRTDNELGKTRQKTNYLARQRSKGSMNKGHMKVSSSCTASGVRRVINSDIPSYFEINFYFDLYIFCVNMFVLKEII